jgi:hypothetical protein
MYIAKSYIGREFVPGEVLPDDLPEEVVERLLRAGAIREVEGVAVSAAPLAPTDPPADPEGEPEDPESEIDDDAEPEEIDVTAGIVTDPAPEKPKRTARKSGGKKS